jgi:transcriptional regulator with XRE-family HTH domain
MSLAPIHRYIGRIIHLMRKEKGMRQSELALLTGLKQPNLSRIENGLVSPRQVTLEKIAKALGVEVQEFYSERKVQEVERKWAASLGPKHAALMLAGKVSPIPLLDTSTGMPGRMDPTGEPQAHLEIMMQLQPTDNEGSQRFAIRVPDDAMTGSGSDSFKPGDVVTFSNGQDVHNGDFAFVMLNDTSVFRKVEFVGGDTFMASTGENGERQGTEAAHIRLIPLNGAYETRVVPRQDVKQMWRIARHMKNY